MNDPDVATTGPARATADPAVGGPATSGPTTGDFESWYRDAHPRLVATLLLVTGDLGLAADSVDEAFARALERWDRVRSMASPTGWTFRVARNVSRRSLRRSALERRLLARSPRPADVPAPAGEIWRIVSDLPLRQREVVVLRHVADLPEAEIAETWASPAAPCRAPSATPMPGWAGCSTSPPTTTTPLLERNPDG